MQVAQQVTHPLVDIHLTCLRNKTTSPQEFRHSLQQLTSFVALHATSDLPLRETTVETPISATGGKVLDARVGLIPILRAGIGMVNPVLDLIPTAEVWHLGLYRDEATATPIHYYSKLPPGNPVDHALILDPMLATGGSACLACESLMEWGVGSIKLLSIIAAPEGIDRLAQQFPDVEVFTCVIDERLNDDKFIVPGLGDAGDRVFNTT